ncbi:hypothetical protein G7054_g256 [Neopestalotiopsis clavispora]|nr:hypothetical protein G7054_g256 [Neopestalotiopsis clavispora]
MQNTMHMLEDDASYPNTAMLVAAAAGHGMYAPDATNMAAFNVQPTPPHSTFSEQHRPASPVEEASAAHSDLSSHSSHEITRTQIDTLPCSCIHDAVSIMQQLDDDHFRITTLSLDQVLWLQKNILAQCDKPLQCDACNKLPTVHSVLFIICDRLTEMFECIHKRLKRVNVLISQYLDPESTSGASSSHESSEQSSGQLFCSTTGQKADKAPCNLDLFQSGPQSSFSSEEQLHMIEALLKLQIIAFKTFLARVRTAGSAVSNLARESKLESLMTRLNVAGNNISQEIKRHQRPSSS